jgi:hypothetical protein
MPVNQNIKHIRKRLCFEASFAEQTPSSTWEDLNDYLTSIHFFNNWAIDQLKDMKSDELYM